MTEARKVLIRGHVFDYAEKAPFVVSGVSVLGAIEYDDQTERVKCHECGEWFGLISNTHVREKHDISLSIYKFRHGINQSSPVCTPSHSATMRRTNPNLGKDSRVIKSALEKLKSAPGQRKRLHIRKHAENDNLEAGCRAQTLFRIQTLAASVGRTPTDKELEKEKLRTKMQRHFGSIPAALVEAGLQLRDKSTCGGSKLIGGSLPANFPTKQQLDDARMPWPKEYFGVRHLERKGSVS